MDSPDTAFRSWMRAVDQVLLRKYDVTHLDLPDPTWRDWFDDGLTPSQAVAEIDPSDL